MCTAGVLTRLTAMVLERLGNYDELGEVKQPVLVQEPAPIVEAAEPASAVNSA